MIIFYVVWGAESEYHICFHLSRLDFSVPFFHYNRISKNYFLETVGHCYVFDHFLCFFFLGEESDNGSCFNLLRINYPVPDCLSEEVILPNIGFHEGGLLWMYGAWFQPKNCLQIAKNQGYLPSSWVWIIRFL